MDSTIKLIFNEVIRRERHVAALGWAILNPVADLIAMVNAPHPK
ncbi:MAG: hypothetical protein ABSE00_11180 [Chitinispirillaceae bacterium]|jgi:hypothetical protein